MSAGGGGERYGHRSLLDRRRDEQAEQLGDCGVIGTSGPLVERVAPDRWTP